MQEFMRDIEQAKGLAVNMIHGKTVLANQQMNASNIYYKYYEYGYRENYKIKISENDMKLIEMLDGLISLYAIKEIPKQNKEIIHSYLSNNENVKNIQEMMNMYKTYVIESSKDMFVSAFNPLKKGFFDSKNDAKMYFDLIPEDEVEYYTSWFGNLKNIGYFGEINGVKYYKLVGRGHEPGFVEGALSIASMTTEGISITKLLRNQLVAENRKKRKSQRAKEEDISAYVSNTIDQIIKNEGRLDNIAIDIPDGAQLIPVHDAVGNIYDYVVQLKRQEK